MSQSRLREIILSIVLTFFIASTKAATDYDATELKTVLPTPRLYTNAYFDGFELIYITGGQKNGNSFSGGDGESTNEILRFNIITEEIETIAQMNTSSKLAGCVYSDMELMEFERIYCFDAGDATKEDDLFVHRLKFDEQREFENIGAFSKYGGVEYFDVVSNGGEDIWAFSETGYIIHFNISNEQSTFTLDRLSVNTKSSTVWHDGKIYFFSDFTKNFAIYQYTPFLGQSSIELSAKLPYGITGASLLSINDTIYFLSGFPDSNDPIKALKTFEPSNNYKYAEYTVSNFEDRVGSSSVYVPQLNRIYVFGGEIYDKNLGKFVTLDTISYIKLSRNNQENNENNLGFSIIKHIVLVGLVLVFHCFSLY